ncbi:unnamed protein product [Urochloa humidicola]
MDLDKTHHKNGLSRHLFPLAQILASTLQQMNEHYLESNGVDVATFVMVDDGLQFGSHREDDGFDRAETRRDDEGMSPPDGLLARSRGDERGVEGVNCGRGRGM